MDLDPLPITHPFDLDLHMASNVRVTRTTSISGQGSSGIQGHDPLAISDTGRVKVIEVNPASETSEENYTVIFTNTEAAFNKSLNGSNVPNINTTHSQETFNTGMGMLNIHNDSGSDVYLDNTSISSSHTRTSSVTGVNTSELHFNKVSANISEIPHDSQFGTLHIRNSSSLETLPSTSTSNCIKDSRNINVNSSEIPVQIQPETLHNTSVGSLEMRSRSDGGVRNKSETMRSGVDGIMVNPEPDLTPILVPATSMCKQQYQCRLCPSVFSNRWNCVSHMRAHSRTRPSWDCSTCGKRCSKRSELQIHMRVHSGEKPFSCSVCQRGFRRQGQLNAHMRSHGNDKPFLCSDCGASFVNASNLKRHQQLHMKTQNNKASAHTVSHSHSDSCSPRLVENKAQGKSGVGGALSDRNSSSMEVGTVNVTMSNWVKGGSSSSSSSTLSVMDTQNNVTMSNSVKGRGTSTLSVVSDTQTSALAEGNIVAISGGTLSLSDRNNALSGTLSLSNTQNSTKGNVVAIGGGALSLSLSDRNHALGGTLSDEKSALVKGNIVVGNLVKFLEAPPPFSSSGCCSSKEEAEPLVAMVEEEEASCGGSSSIIMMKSNLEVDPGSTMDTSDQSMSSMSLYEQIENFKAENTELYLSQGTTAAVAAAVQGPIPSSTTLSLPQQQQQLVIISPGGQGEVEEGTVVKIPDTVETEAVLPAVSQAGTAMQRGDADVGAELGAGWLTAVISDGGQGSLGLSEVSMVNPPVLEPSGEALTSLMQTVDWSFLLEDPSLAGQDQSMAELVDPQSTPYIHPPPQPLTDNPSTTTTTTTTITTMPLSPTPTPQEERLQPLDSDNIVRQQLLSSEVNNSEVLSSEPNRHHHHHHHPSRTFTTVPTASSAHHHHLLQCGPTTISISSQHNHHQPALSLSSSQQHHHHAPLFLHPLSSPLSANAIPGGFSLSNPMQLDVDMNSSGAESTGFPAEEEEEEEGQFGDCNDGKVTRQFQEVTTQPPGQCRNSVQTTTGPMAVQFQGGVKATGQFPDTMQAMGLCGNSVQTTGQFQGDLKAAGQFPNTTVMQARGRFQSTFQAAEQITSGRGILNGGLQDTGQIKQFQDTIQGSGQFLDTGQFLGHFQDNGQTLTTGQVLGPLQDTGQIAGQLLDSGQLTGQFQGLGQTSAQLEDTGQITSVQFQDGTEMLEHSEDTEQTATEEGRGDSGEEMDAEPTTTTATPVIIILEHPYGIQQLQNLLQQQQQQQQGVQAATEEGGSALPVQVLLESLTFPANDPHSTTAVQPLTVSGLGDDGMVTLLTPDLNLDLDLAVHGHDYTSTVADQPQCPPPSSPHPAAMKSTADKTLACDLCPRRFTRQWYLTVHRKAHLRERSFTCQVCQVSFSRVGNLNRHKLIHTGHKPFSCPRCPASFANRYRLADHQRRHDGIKLHRCDVCQSAFGDVSSLRRHRSTHSGDHLSFTCDVCGASFKTINSLTCHQKVHTKEEGCGVSVDHGDFTAADVPVLPFDPDQEKLSETTSMAPTILKITTAAAIGQTTDTSTNTTSPTNSTTTTITEFVCSICHKSFPFSTACRQHIFCHLGSRPFKCTDCGASFARKACARRHTATHRRTKRNACSQCGEKFQTRPRLLLHEDGHRPVHSLTVPCQDCGAKFSQQSLVHVHRKIFHRQVLSLFKPGVGVVNRRVEEEEEEEEGDGRKRKKRKRMKKKQGGRGLVVVERGVRVGRRKSEESEDAEGRVKKKDDDDDDDDEGRCDQEEGKKGGWGVVVFGGGGGGGMDQEKDDGKNGREGRELCTNSGWQKAMGGGGGKDADKSDDRGEKDSGKGQPEMGRKKLVVLWKKPALPENKQQQQINLDPTHHTTNTTNTTTTITSNSSNSSHITETPAQRLARVGKKKRFFSKLGNKFRFSFKQTAEVKPSAKTVVKSSSQTTTASGTSKEELVWECVKKSSAKILTTEVDKSANSSSNKSLWECVEESSAKILTTEDDKSGSSSSNKAPDHQKSGSECSPSSQGSNPLQRWAPSVTKSTTEPDRFIRLRREATKNQREFLASLHLERKPRR